MTEYWFARRFPVGNPRGGMAPVGWKGWAVVGGFVLLDLTGTAALVVMALNDRLWLGLGMFAAMTAIGGASLIYSALTKGDPNRTVAEYRALRAVKGGSLVR